MRILFGLCVCLCVASVQASEVGVIDSVESLAKAMRRYEILRTETSSDMRQMRNQITGFLHQNHDLIRSQQEQTLIDASCDLEYLIVDHEFQPILETLKDQIIRFKTSASSAQMARADLLHQREIQGEKARISVLEPSSDAYHAHHVDSTIKQISPLSCRPEPKFQKSYHYHQLMKYYFKKYFTFNSQYPDCEIINLSMSPAGKDSTLGFSVGIFTSIGFNFPYSLSVKASGNNGYALTNLLDSDYFLYQLLLGDWSKRINISEQILGSILSYMVKDMLNSSMIIVGSIGSGNVPSVFSNRPGEEEKLQKIFIWALGSDVVANVNGKNMRYSGTSMAAPSVTGVAALIAGKYPSFSKTDIKECILESARQDFFVENYKARTSIHVSKDFDKVSIVCKGEFLEAKEPYTPSVWGKGILDATRALDYAELKTLGESKDDIVKILNFREKWKQKKIIRRLDQMMTQTPTNSQGSLLDTLLLDSYGHVYMARTCEDHYTTKFLDHYSSILYDSIKSGNLEQIQEFFMNHKWMRCSHNEHGQTPLNFSILKGNTEIARFFIENRKILVFNQNGWTPLFFAVLTDNIEIAKLILLEWIGAKDDTVRGKRPIDFAKGQEMKDLLSDEPRILTDSQN